ncbi:MAG: tRNA-intron lyase [Candidatus Ranarchaeia archaeon]|jgi:tRNA-intron endonuclease
MKKQNRKKVRISTYLVNGRVIIWTPEDGATLFQEGFYGKPLGVRKPKKGEGEFDRPYELSIIEAYYLQEKGRIQIIDSKTGKKLSKNEVVEKVSRSFNMFRDKYQVYKDLRDSGRIVKPGLKFGADFAVYKQGPGIDHAPYVVSVLPKGSKLTAMNMVLAGRLATSVKKRFVLANLSAQDKPMYFAFSWVKP